MAVLAANINGHIQSQLTRSLERILEDANQSGELKLSNRKLKDFPKASTKYNLSDTVIAGREVVSCRIIHLFLVAVFLYSFVFYFILSYTRSLELYFCFDWRF